jgi:hypothetical protein
MSDALINQHPDTTHRADSFGGGGVINEIQFFAIGFMKVTRALVASNN